MSNYRSQADASQRAHANRIITSAGGGAHSTPFGEGGSVKPKGYKNGGRCYEEGGLVEEVAEGEMSAPRLDRPSRKGKGATTVNVIVAQKDPVPPAPPMPMPPMPAAPPPPPPGLGAGGPPMPPEAMMGRKRGGRVTYDAGAGSAPGRMEKIEAYGAKAGKPAKTPKGD